MDKLLKIATRISPLAIKQVDEVMANFPEIKAKIIQLQSLGDKQKKVSLMSDEVPEDFFTRELDQMLLKGKADIAIHSAKDLPYPMPKGLEIIALTKAFDNRDALVSRNDETLANLKKGSRIGTSSKLRQDQILKLRPDIKILSIRGTIEERLKQLDQGKYDAIIVAVCALKRLGLQKRISEILKIESHPLQGSLAVVAKTNRPDLKVLFSKIDVRKTYGKVFLIGGGIGDPLFLTLKADQIMQKADIIFYDELISNGILEKYNCKKIFVGRRKGKETFSQGEVSSQLYKAALKYKIVVRLKGGDPLLFSRGGEELEYLKRRSIYVEVVPGISAYQAAAASMLLPLTKRYVNNQLSLKTAQSSLKETKELKIFYMGGTKISEIKREIMDLGKNMPVLIISNAGASNEEIILTNINDIDKQKPELPALVMVGENIRNYSDQEKILFTGLDPHNCPLQKKLVHYQLIRIKPLHKKILNINGYDAILFTSKNAVRSFFCEDGTSSPTRKTGCLNLFFSRYKPINQKIISIGPETSKEIKAYGYIVDHQPKTADSDDLVELVKTLPYKKILYPTSQLSDNNLHRLLQIKPIVIYRTELVKQPKINLKKYSGVVFSSASTVSGFFKIYMKMPSHLVAYAYGKHTAKKLQNRGCKYVQTL